MSQQVTPKTWKETTLGEVAEFSNGRTSPERLNSGKYEVFGSNGVFEYCNSVDYDDMAPANNQWDNLNDIFG
jgi:hypothetical protein